MTCKLLVVLVGMLLLVSVPYANAQSISCSELGNFIEEEARRSDVAYCRFSSSWLGDVELYVYDGVYFVIAEMKANKFSYSYNSYIFCGIPYNNWWKFKTRSIDGSYGKSFHAYIMDYTCNCY